MHDKLRIRFHPEIRNGDGNFMKGLRGTETPAFVDVDPFNIEASVTEAMRQVVPPTIRKVADLLPQRAGSPHHD